MLYSNQIEAFVIVITIVACRQFLIWFQDQVVYGELLCILYHFTHAAALPFLKDDQPKLYYIILDCS